MKNQLVTTSLYGAGKHGKFLRQFLRRSTVYTKQYMNETIAYESLQGPICILAPSSNTKRKQN